MGDEAHVRLVDPHAESDGGEGDDAVLAQKTVLIGVAPARVEPRVIDQSLERLFGEIFGEPLGPGARGAIDNAALAPARAQEALQLLSRLVLGGEFQRNIGPVEGMDEDLRLQRRTAVRRFPRASRESAVAVKAMAWTGADFFRACADQPIFGPEIMAPFADAMGLVHRDARAHLPATAPRSGRRARAARARR